MLPEADLLCSEAVVCRSGQAKLCLPGKASLSAVMCGSVQASLCSEGSVVCRSLQAKLCSSSSVAFGCWLIAISRATGSQGYLVLEFV